jgi:hypothetical protein
MKIGMAAHHMSVAGQSRHAGVEEGFGLPKPNSHQAGNASEPVSTLGRHLERRGIGGDDGALSMRDVGRHPVIGHRLCTVDPIRQHLFAGRPERRRAEVWAHIFPGDLARGGYLEEAAIHAFIDERVAVGQSAGIADEGAMKGPLGPI